MVNHYCWQDTLLGKKGRIAVDIQYNCLGEIEGDTLYIPSYIRLQCIAGDDLPVGRAIAFLDFIFPNWLSISAEQHLKRQRPWRVETRTGRSGCITYIMREIRDFWLNDTPIVARLHVTFTRKIHEFAMAFENLAPIMAHLRRDFTQGDQYFVVKEAIMQCTDEFNSPGAPYWSGLPE